MRNPIRPFVAGAFAIGFSIVYAPVVFISSYFSTDATDAHLRFWSECLLRVTGVTSNVVGLENVPTENFVLTSNHQSHFDPLVIFRHIHRHMRFIAKKQLFQIPVFGQALRKVGNVSVERDKGSRDKDTILNAAQSVRERVSIVFFAEGTRSADGNIRPFKKGAAALAIAAQAPILPVFIDGAFRVQRKGEFRAYAHHVTLRIGKPISTAGKSEANISELTRAAQDAVMALAPFAG